MEKTASDAPCHLSAEGAGAWADGYNTALAAQRTLWVCIATDWKDYTRIAYRGAGVTEKAALEAMYADALDTLIEIARDADDDPPTIELARSHVDDQLVVIGPFEVTVNEAANHLPTAQG